MSTPPSATGFEKLGQPLILHGDTKTAAESVSSASGVSERIVAGATFAEGGKVSYYEPIAKYEGRHRYDPSAQWTEAEETRLVRRVRTCVHYICLH